MAGGTGGIMQRLWRRLSAGLLVSAGALTALNWACGFIVGDTCHHLDLVDAASVSMSHSIFQPHQHKRIVFPGLKPYRVTINNLGLRGPDLPLVKPEGAMRILCLGDSHTFGLFVNDEDTYPWQLQQTLDPSMRSIQVLNAGVGGTTISDHLDYLKRWGVALAPDVIHHPGLQQRCA